METKTKNLGRVALIGLLLIGVLIMSGCIGEEKPTEEVPEEGVTPTPAPTPVAAPTLDQSQTSTPGNTGLEGDCRLSQGFTLSMPILTSVEVYVGSVHANLSYPLTLQIRGDSNGLPSGTVLASTSATIARKGWEWITFDLPDLSVNPGTRYHLVLCSLSNYHVGLDSTNPYPYGCMGYSTDTGATWKILHDNQNYDMAFKIHGMPSEEITRPEETPTLGEDASESITISGTIIGDYSQGEIFIGAYESVYLMPPGTIAGVEPLQESIGAVSIWAPGTYSFQVPVNSGEVWVAAINDANNDGVFAVDMEPAGKYPGNPLIVGTEDIENVNIALHDGGLF